VVVHNLDIPGIATGPPKANAPLAIDPDAHLPGAVTFEAFQPIAWRFCKSSRVAAASSWAARGALDSEFLSENFRVVSPCHMRCVSLHLKDRIIRPSI
jgi:hypothetical protein